MKPKKKYSLRLSTFQTLDKLVNVYFYSTVKSESDNLKVNFLHRQNPD